jgi:hypothetical protein
VKWLALLGGHVAWSVQLLVGYALAEPACAGGWHAGAVAAVTGAALVVAAVAGGTSLALLGRVGDGVAARRDRFVGSTGLLLSGVYLFAIVLAGGALALVGLCG